jgi:nucleoside-diphosphate-sugar epimerase
MKRNRQPKVIVTGVAGFIGSNLAAQLLAKGFSVIGIDNLSYGVRRQIPRGVKFHKLDIRSEAIYPLFRDARFVFHLAAKNCISDCQNDPVATSDINVTGSVNVFEASKRAGVYKVIYAESSALYEGIREYPTTEKVLAPQSVYAVSKLAGNAFAESYARFYGLRTTALRYFNVYGPRQDYRRTIPPVMSAFIIKLLRNERPTIYGTGRNRRDFIHVDDINAFHELCMHDRRTDGHVYNLGSGMNYSVLQIYAIIARMLGIDLRPHYCQALDGEAKVTLADNSRARRLGWKPTISLESGLLGLISYIKVEMARGNIS